MPNNVYFFTTFPYRIYNMYKLLYTLRKEGKEARVKSFQAFIVQKKIIRS